MASVSQSPAPRAVIYAPFSIREQGEGGYSLDAQAADGRKLAIELGTTPPREPAKTLRAALYSRVSTRLQAEHGFSLRAQDKDGEQLASELGAAVVARYVDNDSGASWDLPQLNEMLDAAKRREFDLLICYDPDRLARNMAQSALGNWRWSVSIIRPCRE